MSFDISMSEVLTQLRSSVWLYEEIIRKLNLAQNNAVDDTQRAEMIERLTALKQKAKDLEKHLSAND